MSEQIDKIKKGEKNQKKKLSAGEIVGVVLCALLVPILLINVAMIIQGLVNPAKVPSVGGYSPLIVLTDSMYPGIKSGDLIIIKSVDEKDVKVGDVISFFDPDGSGTSVLTHRVVELVEDGGKLFFRTKGDANNAEDPSLAPAENLIGLYKSRINGAGNVAMFLQSTPGLIVCIAVPLVLLVGFELLRRRNYEKAKSDDTAALLKELEELRAKQAQSNAEKDKTE
ncbi:MAG: signal peptidase I [Oscillospiraceae bacterium]|nr:signal peptidase I [Oscillospiraceae bacterium]